MRLYVSRTAYESKTVFAGVGVALLHSAYLPRYS
jgi:hypothetical protein